MHGIQKDGTAELILQGSGRDSGVENRLVDVEARGGEDGANGESRMKTCATICEIDSQWELAV